MAISRERILNLIIYVMMDQAYIAQEAEEEDEGACDFHKAVLIMREKPQYFSEIELWINRHIEYVQNPDNIFDPRYYELIKDAICIIYCDDFNKTIMSGLRYAQQCENKYANS